MAPRRVWTLLLFECVRYITSDGRNDPDTVSTPVCEARQSVLLTRFRPLSYSTAELVRTRYRKFLFQ